MKTQNYFLRCGLTCLFTVLVFLYVGMPVSASVIDFDDIPNVPGNANQHQPLGFVPDGYHGFIWDAGFNVIKEETFKGFYGNSASFHSFDQALTNNGTDVASIYSSTPFDFLGGWFIAFGDHDQKANLTSTSIEFRFYRGTTLVGPSPTFDLLLDQFSEIRFSDDWVRGINRVEMIPSSHGIANAITTSWIMDDMVFDREPAPENPVPEPSTAILFITGMLGLLGLTRKEKR